MNPLADLLLGPARRDGDVPVITTEDGEVWTRRDLLAASSRLAHLLVARGVQPGDRVAVQVPTARELIALHVAAARAGAVWLPLNLAYTPTEVAALLDDAEPALVVQDLEALVAAAQDLPEDFDDVPREPGDPASMLYTSGTTGRPKGAVLSHGNLVWSASTLVREWGFTEDDRLLHVLPLFHTHGLFVAAHCVLASGASMVLYERFDPAAVIDALPGCTVLMGVPTHYTRLLAHPGFDEAATRSTRLFTSGSAPMLVSTHEEVTARTGQVVLERYGMTETCMLTSNPLHGVRKPGTVGPPLPGVEVRLDPALGGVEVRGPNVLEGYWRRPELAATEFTDDGWFITGDLGRFDADGYLEIVGRSKDLVITGGLNVHPKEVEAVLDALPGVVESAVIGLPDPDFGEAVVAVVVGDVDPQQLVEQAREHLAGFKVPKRVVVVAELPRNAMGKVEKARLRQDLA